MLAICTPTAPDLLFVVLDLESGERWDCPATNHMRQCCGRARWRPFGLTWSADRLFVANEQSLLVFDWSFDLLAVHRGLFFANSHALERDRRGDLLSVCCWANALVHWSLATHTRRVYDLVNCCWLDGDPADVGKGVDAHHFNAAAFSPARLCVLGHNRGRQSFVRVLTKNYHHDDDLELDASQAHGLAYVDGALWTLDTGGGGDLVATTGERMQTDIPTGRFARGWAWDGGARWAIAHAAPSEKRVGRATGAATIAVDDGHRRRDWVLAGTGAINELRFLDVDDVAHQSTPPPRWDPSRLTYRGRP